MQKQPPLESNLINQAYPECHTVFWWSVKVAAGSIIIASLFIGYIYDLRPWFTVSRLFAQSLVLIGGISSIYHYLKLRSANNNIERPERLQTSGGLYRFVRHPMYLSDVFAYSGLFLLFPSMPTMVVLVIGYIALIQQAKVEDQYLRQRFNDEFFKWESRSKLLIPFVY